MATTKRIVCLANSRKLNGRCVAGREVLDGDPGPWVRRLPRRPRGLPPRRGRVTRTRLGEDEQVTTGSSSCG